jgi:hypothetical protein
MIVRDEHVTSMWMIVRDEHVLERTKCTYHNKTKRTLTRVCVRVSMSER